MKTLNILLPLLVLSLTSSVYAAESAGTYIGLEGGISNGNENGVGSNGTYGATLGTSPGNGPGFGLFYNYIPLNSASFAGLTGSSKLQLAGAELNYFITQDPSRIHLGVKGGAEFSSVNLNDLGNTDTFGVVGPVVGYDFLFAPGISLGVEANYLFSLSSNGVSLFEGLGVLKFWF